MLQFIKFILRCVDDNSPVVCVSRSTLATLPGVHREAIEETKSTGQQPMTGVDKPRTSFRLAFVRLRRTERVVFCKGSRETSPSALHLVSVAHNFVTMGDEGWRPSELSANAVRSTRKVVGGAFPTLLSASEENSER